MIKGLEYLRHQNGLVGFLVVLLDHAYKIFHLILRFEDEPLHVLVYLHND